MRIGKPILLVATPVGMIVGLREAWRLGGGGLLVLITLMMLFFGVGIAIIVGTIRSEKRAEAERRRATPPGSGPGGGAPLS